MSRLYLLQNKALTPDASVLDKPAGLESELFRLLFESAVIAKFAPKDKQRYINDMTTAQDIKNQIAYARAQGEEKGMQEGIEKGKLQMAKELKDEGVAVEIISRASGLSEERIATL